MLGILGDCPSFKTQTTEVVNLRGGGRGKFDLKRPVDIKQDMVKMSTATTVYQFTLSVSHVSLRKGLFVCSFVCLFF